VGFHRLRHHLFHDGHRDTLNKLPAFWPEQPGVIRMEFIADSRRRHLVGGESIRAMARDRQRSRPTVRQALTTLSEPVDHRQHQPVAKRG
jgi:hypothetical protein